MLNQVMRIPLTRDGTGLQSALALGHPSDSNDRTGYVEMLPKPVCFF